MATVANPRPRAKRGPSRSPNPNPNPNLKPSARKRTARAAPGEGRAARAAPVAPASVASVSAGVAQAAETRLWLRLLACCNLVEAQLRNRLRGDFGTTLARFDVLTQIERPPEGPTMSQLSERLMVTKGNMTDVIGRLEAEQLVERRRDELDARVQRVYLTPAGLQAVAQMLPAHNAWLAELMRDFDRQDMKQLDELLGRLRDLLRPGRSIHS